MRTTDLSPPIRAGSPRPEPAPLQPREPPRLRRRRWIATGLAALVLGASVIVLPPGAPGHSILTTIGGVVPAFAQTDSQSAIQLVIQRANDEQGQALSTGN